MQAFTDVYSHVSGYIVCTPIIVHSAFAKQRFPLFDAAGKCIAMHTHMHSVAAAAEPAGVAQKYYRSCRTGHSPSPICSDALGSAASKYLQARASLHTMPYVMGLTVHSAVFYLPHCTQCHTLLSLTIHNAICYAFGDFTVCLADWSRSCACSWVASCKQRSPPM